jgi:hypothetical protein
VDPSVVAALQKANMAQVVQAAPPAVPVAAADVPLPNLNRRKSKGGVGELMDRSAPWANIVGGSGESNNGDHAGMSLKYLAQLWSKRLVVEEKKKGEEKEEEAPDGQEDEEEQPKVAAPGPDMGGKKASGKWVMGKWREDPRN